MLSLYNTLTKKKEEFFPMRNGCVSMYSCGPTVYNYAHIGNLRAFITADVLARALRYNRYVVLRAMNTTDVDDKTISGASLLPEYANDPKSALKHFTQKYEEEFWKDITALNVEKPKYITRATEYISAMEVLINKIHTAGFAYEKDGSVYFDVAKYAAAKKYGILVDIDTSHLLSGVRESADEYAKENARDFALWKKTEKGEPSWTLSFDGQNLNGRPGWHIECSAMAHQVLPSPFDIHTGGIDLRFPHHENEIAQSTAGYGAMPAHFWVHNDHILVDRKKMAKSEDNFITLQTIIKEGFSPLAYRYWLLTAHYRTPVNFTWEALGASRTAFEKLCATFWELSEARSLWMRIFGAKPVIRYCELFKQYINDDLDTPRALALVWEVLKDDTLSPAQKYATLSDFDSVLGLGLRAHKPANIPKKIQILANEREQYRKNKNWQKSDELRAKITALGYEVKDTDEGPLLSKK